jgi:hypothetical protein
MKGFKFFYGLIKKNDKKQTILQYLFANCNLLTAFEKKGNTHY